MTMQSKPTIRDAWDYLYNQSAISNAKPAATPIDPLQIKREYFAQQLANVVMHKAMQVKA
jgi:hypothetical protein